MSLKSIEMSHDDQGVATTATAEPMPIETSPADAGVPAASVPLAVVTQKQHVSASTLASGAIYSDWWYWWYSVGGGKAAACFFPPSDAESPFIAEGLRPYLADLKEMKNAIEFPSFLNDVNKLELESMETIIQSSPLGKRFIDEVVKFKKDKLCEDDKHRVKNNLIILFAAWYSVRVSDGEKEADMRRGPDKLFELVFDIQNNMKMRTECDMALPVTLPASLIDLPPPTVFYEVTSTVADTTISQAFPADVEALLAVLPGRWDLSSRRPSYLLVIVEYKLEHESVIRQVLMGMLTAATHRQHVGIDKLPIYGATVQSSVLTIYVGLWKDGESKNFEVAKTDYSWDLRVPGQFLECYLFLCSLAKVIAEKVVRLSNMEAKVKTALQDGRKWRMDKPRKSPVTSRKSKPSSGNTSKHKGAPAQRDEVEELSSTDDDSSEPNSQLPSYMPSVPSYERVATWRMEVV